MERRAEDRCPALALYFTFLRPFAELAGVELDWTVPRDSTDLYPLLELVDGDAGAGSRGDARDLLPRSRDRTHPPMTVRAADERAHEPGASSWWWETWHLDAATDDGIGLSVRLACAPALGVAWWWTYLVLPDLPGPVVVRDHEVPLPRQGLEVRADGLWGELTCETALEHWTYGLEAFGVRLDEPADALRGEIGERMPVGLDIEWEVELDANDPHERPAGWPVRGYTQTGSVRGEVLLGRSRIELDAVGQRSHTWGEPRFDAPRRPRGCTRRCRRELRGARRRSPPDTSRRFDAPAQRISVLRE